MSRAVSSAVAAKSLTPWAVRLAAIAVPASEIAVLVDATSVAAVAAFVTKVAMVPVGPRAMLAAMLAVINTWIAAASTSAAAI